MNCQYNKCIHNTKGKCINLKIYTVCQPTNYYIPKTGVKILVKNEHENNIKAEDKGGEE